MTILIILGLFALAVLGFFIWYAIFRKRLRFGNLSLITGGVKTGKTQLSVCLVEKQYNRQIRKWKRRCIRHYLSFKPLPEQPLIYSNMPIGKLGDVYSPLTLDLITGKTRFRYGSVIYYNECSLIAGSKDIKDEVLNDHLLQFFKLVAHKTKGGYAILDTQSPQDIHYTIKRSLSTYLFIYKNIKLPFFSLLWVRENLLVDGENTVALDTQVDPQDKPSEGGKRQYPRIVSNKWWKYYDQHAYSDTDGYNELPVSDELVTVDSRANAKKVEKLIRVRDIKNALKELKGGLKK